MSSSDIDPSIAALAERAAGKALLALDVGSKTVGVAAADPLWMTATPVETIKRTKFSADAARILVLCDERSVGGLIIGLPVNMDGSEGPRAQSTRAFARNLAQKTDLPVAFWDERLSTFEAEEELKAMGVRRDKRAEVIDQAAAVVILRGALGRLRTISGSRP